MTAPQQVPWHGAQIQVQNGVAIAPRITSVGVACAGFLIRSRHGLLGLRCSLHRSAQGLVRDIDTPISVVHYVY